MTNPKPKTKVSKLDKLLKMYYTKVNGKRVYTRADIKRLLEHI